MGPELLTRDLWLKLAALGLAVLAWIVVLGSRTTSQPVEAPIDVAVEDPGWTLAGRPAPDTATVVFKGSYSQLLSMVHQPTRLVVSIQQVSDTVRTVDLDSRMVRVGDAYANTENVAEVKPSRIHLRFEPVESALRPVSVRTRGQLPRGSRLAGPAVVQPPMVRVSGARSRLRALDSVPTQPISMNGLTRPETLDVFVDTTALHGFLVSPRRLRVVIPATSQADTAQRDTTQRDTTRKGPGGAREPLVPGRRP